MLFKTSSIIITLLSFFTFLQPTLADDPETSYTTLTLTTNSKTVITTSELPQPTLVWATGYDENGELRTTQSTYTQTFAKFWTKVSDVPAGSIGLGSITGTVGTVRVYPSTTVSNIRAKR
ncbi:putative secreted protein [Wickerhamomyces ciferrii]|uniref:Secreted protein n=1 Tax=Wickerhamomyces ciferrii (strain ATCC 14091 / BCRC 22168 / CBS 111 / JCM 3599 / NBRC 0793 / NRRL Y-1031 F-60-10) TaxID=1206466 RepID=K0KFU6_WICCF|nr:uncharacterized protein BN7_1310 [Wickerhamomyces ciferrii]CCH41771.1 putative secreted protein [Wickerhamomyces ciferrii]